MLNSQLHFVINKCNQQAVFKQLQHLLVFDMKLFNAVAIFSSLTAADEKKVPPRTPIQRLNTLHRFYERFIDSQLAQYREFRATNQKEKAHIMMAALWRAFEKTNRKTGERRCGYFNPSLPHGGPRPISSEENRRRRDVDDEEDPFDAYELSLQNGERSASVRLSADPALALRQVF